MSGHSSSNMDALYRMSLAEGPKKERMRLNKDVEGAIAMAATWTMATATHAKSPPTWRSAKQEGLCTFFAYSPPYSRTPSFATTFPPLTT